VRQTAVAVILQDLEVLGVHPIEVSQMLFDETVELQWGAELPEPELARARECVREHFAGLYLLEIRVSPPDAEIDWLEITQPLPETPRANWQVAYDERPIDAASGTWAFFFHCLVLDKPIDTPVGPRSLPAPRPRPVHLQAIEYASP